MKRILLRILLFSALNYFVVNDAASAQAITRIDTFPSLVVYITFDDGPTEYSHFIDTIVRKERIPVEVFFIGSRSRANSEMIGLSNSFKKDSLIQVANHSYSHANGRYKKYYGQPAQVISDVLMNVDSLQLPSRIVRLPGRNTWRIGDRKKTDLLDANKVADSLAGMGFMVFGWDLEWRYDSCHERYYSAEQMLSLVKSTGHLIRPFTRGHLVILCHDWMLPDSYFREQFSIFVETLKKSPTIRFSKLGSYPYSPMTTPVLNSH